MCADKVSLSKTTLEPVHSYVISNLQSNSNYRYKKYNVSKTRDFFFYLDISASFLSKCRHSCRLCVQNPPPGRSHADSCTPRCSQNQADPSPPRPHGAGSLAAYMHGLEGREGTLDFRVCQTEHVGAIMLTRR